MFESNAQRVLSRTSEVIAQTGPRLAGGESCLRAARLLVDMARDCCDKVVAEKFSVHPGAFLGFIRVMVLIYLVSIPALILAPWAATALTSVGVFVLCAGFFLYKPVLDPFYPRKEGLNVIGSLEPSGKVERQVIVSGHHDSAHVFNFLVDRPELYAPRLYGGMGMYAALWLVSFPLAILGSSGFSPIQDLSRPMTALPRIMAALVFALGFIPVATLWRFAGKQGTPGAGDNLASSITALEIARVFAERRGAPGALTSTRVVFISFDAEEAGLRGARAYVAAHRAELRALPTFAFNMDCVYERDQLMLLLSDLNGSVRLDEETSRRIAELGAREGIELGLKPIAFLTGGTDAAELAKGGVRAASLMGMNWSNQSRSRVYHTPCDKVEAIEPGAVEAAIRLGVRFIEDLDKGLSSVRRDDARDKERSL